jgi:hypothetical protein
MRLEPPVGASGADKSWRTQSCMAIARTSFASVPELEAESVAYVGCRELGIDSSAYSFGYVATWTGGGAEAQRPSPSRRSESRRRRTSSFMTVVPTMTRWRHDRHLPNGPAPMSRISNRSPRAIATPFGR